MIVIIEGLDGVGKTTVAERFSQKYNFEYIKESYTDNLEEKEKRVRSLLQRLESDKNYIYDRTTLIDDFVYSFLNKTESTLSKYKSTILDGLSKCKIFHLVLDEKIRKERFDQRGDEYVTNDMMKQIANNYFDFYLQLDNVITFDLTGDVEKDVDNLMMEVINENKNFTHSIK